MRITKSMAEAAATKMVESKKKEVEKLAREFSEIVTREYQKTLPDSLNYSDPYLASYLRMTEDICLVGNGFNFQLVRLTTPLPTTVTNRFEIPKRVAKEAVDFYDHLQKRKKEVSALKRDITNAIFNLRTLAKITEQFPEALPHIEKTENTAVAINLQSIKERL